VEQATIVVGATGVFHKRSQIEFAKATRLGKKDLARWQRNIVDMALNGSYQLSHESMKRIKFNREHPPAKEVIEELEKHESDLMPDVDEDPEEKEEDPTFEVTGIELYQASVAIREVAKAEKQPLPYLEEYPDGHKKPEVLD
jgi:hypothetical protein